MTSPIINAKIVKILSGTFLLFLLVFPISHTLKDAFNKLYDAFPIRLFFQLKAIAWCCFWLTVLKNPFYKILSMISCIFTLAFLNHSKAPGETTADTSWAQYLMQLIKLPLIIAVKVVSDPKTSFNFNPTIREAQKLSKMIRDNISIPFYSLFRNT